jgi:hypothetical protein
MVSLSSLLPLGVVAGQEQPAELRADLRAKLKERDRLIPETEKLEDQGVTN